MQNTILDALVASAQQRRLKILQVNVRQHNQTIATHEFVPEAPTLLWSVSKSVTSLLAGIAMDAGYFKLTDTVESFFPEYMAKATPSLYLSMMTVHDLLCMGTGQLTCPISKADWVTNPRLDIAELFFAEEVVYAPGVHFMYNNSATYMLARIIERATKVALDTFAYTHLFAPLGIAKPVWDKCPLGHPQGFSGLRLRISELAKIGQLVLDKGVYAGKQIVSSSYIAAATSVQISTSHFDAFYATSDHKAGYGYQFWQNSVPGTARMDGYFGQYVVILPEQDAVVTYVSDEKHNMGGILQLTWRTLIDKL